MKKVWILNLFLFMVCIACGPSGSEKTEEKTEPVDSEEQADVVQTDIATPEDRAIEILTAYQAIELEKLASLSASMIKPYINQMISDRENSQYDSFFDSWRSRAVEKWDGGIIEMKYRSSYGMNQALAGFVFLEEENEVAVLVMASPDGQWLFRDVESIDKEEFDELTSEPETD